VASRPPARPGAPRASPASTGESALSSATSTQWCPSNLALGTAGGVKQSNASAAGSAAGNENRATQNAQHALAAFPGPIVLMWSGSDDEV
jgi:hypothetical protein